MDLGADLEGGGPADEDHQSHDEQQYRQAEYQFEWCQAATAGPLAGNDPVSRCCPIGLHGGISVTDQVVECFAGDSREGAAAQRSGPGIESRG